MNNRYFDGVSQADRELEELLCLAYLFTHSVYDKSPDDFEILLAGEASPYSNYFCN